MGKRTFFVRTLLIALLGLAVGATACGKPKRLRHPDPEPDAPQPIEEPGRSVQHSGPAADEDTDRSAPSGAQELSPANPRP